MQLLTAIQEILTVFGALPNVHYLKFIPLDNACHILSESEKHQFIYYGNIKGKLDGLNEVFGVVDISLLRAIINSPGFKDASAVAEYCESNEFSVACLVFSNASGHTYRFPVVNEKTINKLMPRFKVPEDDTFNVSFCPDFDGIHRFKYWQKKILEYKDECDVGFFTKKKDIYCRYKLSDSDLCSFPFKCDVIGSLEYVRRYKSKDLMALLNFYPESKLFKIAISDSGIMRIYFKRDLAFYKFYNAPLWEDWMEFESPNNRPSDLPSAIENGFGRNMDVEKYIEDTIAMD